MNIMEWTISPREIGNNLLLREKRDQGVPWFPAFCSVAKPSVASPARPASGAQETRRQREDLSAIGRGDKPSLTKLGGEPNGACRSEPGIRYLGKRGRETFAFS